MANQSAIIWVNISSGSSELNIAYGNSLATQSAYKNASIVFQFFDDAESGISATYTADGTFETISDANKNSNVFHLVSAGAWGATGRSVLLFNQNFSDAVFEFWAREDPYTGTAANQVGLVFCVQDVSNYYYAFFEAKNDIIYLMKNVAGSFTTISSVSFADDGAWHNWRIVKSGSMIKIYVDDVLLLTETDTQFASGNFGLRAYSTNNQMWDDIKVLKLADPIDVSSFHTRSFSTSNPSVLLNGNLIEYNGTLDSGQSSGRIPLNLTWLKTGVNNLTFLSAYGSGDVVIRATYTDDVNITITRLLGVERQTLEYTPVENTANASVRLVFSTTDMYHQLWNVTVNGSSWTNYNWSFPHLDIYLGNVSANVTYNVTAEMGYNNPPSIVRDDIRTVRGKSITFSATVTDPEEDSIVSWLWDFGDGTNSTLQNPSHSYSILGTYNCSVTVTDDGNVQSATATKTFRVYVENQLPSVNLVEPANNDYLGSSTVKFIWNGTDPDVDFDTPYFKLYVDGNLVFEGYGTSYTTNLTAGQHTWYVAVTDGIDTVKSETRTLYVLTSPASSTEPTSVPVITSAIIAPYPAVVNREVYIAYTAFDPDGQIVEGRIRVTDPSGTNIDLIVQSAEDLYYGTYKPLTTGTHTVNLLPLDDSGVSASLSIPLEVYATPSKVENIVELRKTADSIFVVSKNARILSSAKTYGDRLIINMDLSMTNATAITVDATSLDFSDISRIVIDPREGLSPLKQPLELSMKIPVKALVILDDLHLIAEDYGAGSVKYDSQTTIITARIKDTVTFELNKNPSKLDEIIHRLLAYLDSILLKV